jgi:hypothetical protein
MKIPWEISVPKLALNIFYAGPDFCQHGHACLGMKTVSEFFGIPETDFEIFRSDSPVTVFFENGIGVVLYRPFLSVTGFCRKLPDLCLEIFSEFSSM